MERMISIVCQILLRRHYDLAGEPKEILWLDTSNHIDLYDNEKYVSPAISKSYKRSTSICTKGNSQIALMDEWGYTGVTFLWKYFG